MKKFLQSDYICDFSYVFPYESIPMLESHLDNQIVQNRYIPFSLSAYPSAWQAEPRVIICGWLLHFAKTRIWDNDTSVIRGPATMKAGR